MAARLVVHDPAHPAVVHERPVDDHAHDLRAESSGQREFRRRVPVRRIEQPASPFIGECPPQRIRDALDSLSETLRGHPEFRKLVRPATSQPRVFRIGTCTVARDPLQFAMHRRADVPRRLGRPVERHDGRLRDVRHGLRFDARRPRQSCDLPAGRQPAQRRTACRLHRLFPWRDARLFEPTHELVAHDGPQQAERGSLRGPAHRRRTGVVLDLRTAEQVQPALGPRRGHVQQAAPLLLLTLPLQPS